MHCDWKQKFDCHSRNLYHHSIIHYFNLLLFYYAEYTVYVERSDVLLLLVPSVVLLNS